MTYVPYYIDKALADANLVGLPISLQTSVMQQEKLHTNKTKEVLAFFEGRSGPVTTNQYQQQVIRQQSQNEVFEMISRPC